MREIRGILSYASSHCVVIHLFVTSTWLMKLFLCVCSTSFTTMRGNDGWKKGASVSQTEASGLTCSCYFGSSVFTYFLYAFDKEFIGTGKICSALQEYVISLRSPIRTMGSYVGDILQNLRGKGRFANMWKIPGRKEERLSPSASCQLDSRQ